MGLSFTITSIPRQRSHSWVRVPRNSWPYFTVSDSRLPQPGGPGPRIYNPHEQGGPVIPQDTGFPFQLAWLRWRYSNAPPHGLLPVTVGSAGVLGLWPRHGQHRKRRFQEFLYCCMLIRCCGRYQAVAAFVSHHVTILSPPPHLTGRT
jgi:hypothetical protein